MKLSTKGKYGLKAMYFLSVKNPDEVTSLTELSKLTLVPQAYLEKIMAQLKKHNLVNSFRGASGGYSLKKPAAEITIGEVLQVLEGDLLVAGCTQQCKSENCPNKNIFKLIDERINNVLNSITLKQMVEGNNNE